LPSTVLHRHLHSFPTRRSSDLVIVDRGMSLRDFVDIYLLKTGQRCFAVEDQGRLVGIITPRDVSNISRDRWDETTVREAMRPLRSEEHTSELQSLAYLVCRLLL